MGTIRAGGIVSGVDTNALIEQLVTQAKEPITSLDNKYHHLELTKNLFQGINNDLSSMKNSMFNLRLESTFKSKLASVSNQSVAGVKVTPEAKVGNYSIEVLQTAKQSQMSTFFGAPNLYTLGAGIKEIKEMPNKYQQQEGDYKTTVSNIGAKEVAVTEFTPNDSRTYSKYTTANNMPTGATHLMDAEGNIDNTWLSTAGNNDITFDYTLDGGVTKSITIDLSTLGSGLSDVKDINHLMSLLEDKINDRLNTELNTVDIQHVAVMAEYDSSAGTWKTAIYDVSEEHSVKVGVSASSNLSDELGFNGGTVDSTVNKMYRYNVADTLANLQKKLESRNIGVIPGVQSFFSGPAQLTHGSFHIYYDSSVVTQKAKPTVVYGTTAGTSINIDDAVESSSLNSSLISNIYGKFTINNVEIDLTDYSNMSIRAVMAVVNGSGAGVTMSFDDATQSFRLSSNKDGSTNLTMGSTGDTSSFFEVFKLSADSGAYRIMGTDGGKMNMDAKFEDEANKSRAVTQGVFSINDVPIYVNIKNDSWNDVVRKINNSGAGVTCTYDAARDKFVFVSNDSTSRIKFGDVDDSSNILTAMGILRDPSVPQELGDPGQNAVIKVNGQTYQRNTNQIDDVVAGMTISAASVGVTSVDVSVDTDKAVDVLASFIKTYNEMVVKLKPGTISKDDRDKKMVALTEEKKAGMSDEEIEKYMKDYDALWTQDITLKNPDIRALLQDFRGNIMNNLDKNKGPFSSLSEIGFEMAGAGDITVSKMGYLMVASTDLEEIRNAITSNSKIMNNLTNKSDEVYQFFGDYEEFTETETEYKQRIAKGEDLSPRKVNEIVYESWARRYERMILQYQDLEGRVGLKTRVDSALNKQMQRIDTEKERISDRAEAYLERLWASFTFMETRIASIQSQADAVAKLNPQNSSSS